MKHKPVWLIVLFTSVIILSACGSSKNTPVPLSGTPAVTTTVVAEGHLFPEIRASINFAQAGKVTDILVDAGEKVTKGQELVRMGDDEGALAALAAAQLARESAQQAYDKALRTAPLAHANAWLAYLSAQQARAAAEKKWEAINPNTIKDEIDDKQATVETKKADLADTQKDFDKYKDLDKDNTTRKNAEEDLRQAQNQYNEAVRQLEKSIQKRDIPRATLDAAIATEAEAKRAYDNTTDGSESDQLVLSKASLDQAESQLAAAQKAVDNYTLTAPFAGTVLGINVYINELVTPELWAVSVGDTSQWIVDTSDLSELDVVNIHPGDQVEVIADALPGVTMYGVVDQINAVPDPLSGTDITYKVRIRMTEVDPNILWGMTVAVTFQKSE
jgi:multidrug efflux pump subunit AcrA (membrane-fusion protein)